MLLAKSPYQINDQSYLKSLPDHNQDAMDAFEALFGQLDQPTWLGKRYLEFFKLSDHEHHTFFYHNGLVACGLHDLGKGNDGFQWMLEGKPEQQVIRHEHLSALLLFLPESQAWLKKLDIDIPIVLSAIVNHHLKATHESFASILNERKNLVLCTNQADFSENFNQINKKFGIKIPNPEIPSQWKLNDATVEVLIEDFKHFFYKQAKVLRQNETKQRTLVAIRNAVILADSAASGLPRFNFSIEQWIKERFAEKDLLDGSYIQQNIIQPRIRQIEHKIQCSFIAKDFQTEAAKLPERALLLAGCGSGKTLAAWYWIEAHLQQQPRSRVIFLYPTRATATEGFRDYVSWAPEGSLVSGTAQYDLQDLFNQPDDERGNRDYTVSDRLYALAYWERKIFSATVDQFLGFMQNVYRSICLLPLLVDAVVVIDEVHSFDRKLFSTLKRFLEFCSVPVLCMTASLTQRRRQELIELGLTVFPGAQQFEDLEQAMQQPRYQLKQLENQQMAEEMIEEMLQEGKRILWVVNTVERCQYLAKHFKNEQPLCYHSRFKLDDRKKQHQAVIHAFQQTSQAVLAFTTQVCEMSLDLDADVLISEYAPITALIQRMGRCNRHAKPGDQKRGQVYLYPSEKFHEQKGDLPYDQEDLTGLLPFIQALSKYETISQSTLETLLEQYGPNNKEKTFLTRLLDDGLWASSEVLRDGEAYTHPAILQNDLSAYFEAKRNKQPIDGLIVPVPYAKDMPWASSDARLGRYMLLAQNDYYSEHYGFAKQAFPKAVEFD